MEATYSLPPHHEAVTFSRLRWWEIADTLLDQGGETPIAARVIIGNLLYVTQPDYPDGYGDEPLTIVLPVGLVGAVRFWEGDERSKPAPTGAGDEGRKA